MSVTSRKLKTSTSSNDA